MVGAGREMWDVADPQREADDGADERADDADGEPVGDQHEPHVAIGRAEGRQHAEPAQPALGEHGETGRRHQADEDQPDEGDREHDDGRRDPVGVMRRHRGDPVSES